MTAIRPPLLVIPDSGRCGSGPGGVSAGGALSTASTTVPYRSAVFEGVGLAGEGEGDGRAVGECDGGRAVLAAVGVRPRTGGVCGVCVTTYAPPATIVAPAVTATAGLVSAPSTLADQP